MSIIIEGRIMALTILSISVVLSFMYMRLAKQGKPITLRNMPAIEALKEAIGRAAEMGKPVYFSTGSLQGGSISNPTQGPQFIAGVSILGYVTQLCVQSGVRLEYFTSIADTLPLVTETLKNAYLLEGVPNEFDPAMINFNQGQSPNLTATLGFMQRERPASCIYMGGFQYETVILGEAGNAIGSMQIAGTANHSQVPFFVATCDYMLIEEELFAASAAISQDPEALGLIRGEDYLKIIVLGLLALGFLVSMTGATFMIDLLGM